jgi:hypothetical protein
MYEFRVTYIPPPKDGGGIQRKKRRRGRVTLGYLRVVRLLGDRIREVFTAFSSLQPSRTDHLAATKQA